MSVCVLEPPAARSLYARTLRALATHRSLGILILVGSLMHAAGHAVLAAAAGVLARTLAGVAGGSVAIPWTLGGSDPAFRLACVGLLAAVAKLVGGVLSSWAEARVAGEVGSALRSEVLERVIGGHALPGPRQDDHGSGRVHRLAALTTHVREVEEGVSRGVLAEARALVQLAPLAVLLAALAPRLAGSAAVALAAFAGLVLAARRALKRGHASAAREAEALLGAADEAVAHADVWIAYGAQKTVRERVAALSRAALATAARLRARVALLSGTSEVLGALALVLVLALAAAGAIGGVERGALVPFAIAFFMAYKPLRDGVDARLACSRARDALAQATDFGLRAPGPVARAPEPCAWPKATLVASGLVAAHGAHAPVSVRVPFGKVAAIVGPTGIGKTSLLRALLGLDPPRAGSVRYGDVDLGARGAGPDARPFAWVPQDAPVLAGSLHDNVGFGARTTEEVDALVASVGGEALVASVRARGAVLATERPVSGGERQWIAVARALATDLPVLLFDEPTSALDGGAQARMLDAIRALRGTRTVVVVTHRPEPLALADVVVRLQGSGIGHQADDPQDGAWRHVDAVRPEELPVEDVRASACGEAKGERAREGVDPRAEQRPACEHEGHLRAETHGAERRRDHVEAVE
jgi:ABC-type multidrug transport system fused ATPase/permease subunit